LLAEQQVQHEAAADVRPRTAEVREDVGIVAAGVFEGIRENGEAVGFEVSSRQEALVVSCLSKGGDEGARPDGVEGCGAERVAEDVSQ